MRNDLIVSGVINIDVAADAVWKVMTCPELIKEYLFGAQTQTDWKVGSDIAFRGEFQGQQYVDHGKILEYVPYQKIAYSYWSAFSGLEDRPENYSIVSYILKTTSEKQTELTWSQKGYADEMRYSHSMAGINKLLAQIKAIAERY